LVVAALAGIAGFYFSPSSLNSRAADGAAHRLMLTSLTDLNSKAQALSQWRGDALVANFWATWCAPWREEIPVLVKVQEKNVASSVRIVGIALEDAVKVRDYAEVVDIGYVLLIGVAATLGMVRGFWQSRGRPAHYSSPGPSREAGTRRGPYRGFLRCSIGPATQGQFIASSANLAQFL
jgi:thiol-disulfide isomerase/thioredoxin